MILIDSIVKYDSKAISDTTPSSFLKGDNAMRKFEIIDSERENARPCAILECDQGLDRFTAKTPETIADSLGKLIIRA